MNSPTKEWRLETHLIGRKILSFDCVDSTNTVADGFSGDAANDGLVVIADAQTAGRGRQGRRWLSSPGNGVILSVLLFPPEHLRRPVILTTLAAVAVCETIYESTQLQATIKWPNDVLIRRRKVCGILVEQGRGTVIGIGLNVNSTAADFEEAALPDAGSLRMFTNKTLEPKSITETLIRHLDVAYHELLTGSVADLQSRWRWHSALLGKQVSVLAGGRVCSGRLQELSFEHIVISSGDGVTQSLSPESIAQLTLADSQKNLEN